MNGTITKRPLKSGGHSWGFSFFAGRDEAGKRQQITRSGFQTKREAADALRRAISEHQAGAIVSKHSRTFAAFFADWLADKRVAPKTLERYGELGRYVIGKFGAVELQKLAPMVLEKSFNELLASGGEDGRPLSARTVRHIAFVVNGCLETAVRWGLLPMNPMNRVQLPRTEKRDPVVLDDRGMYQFLEAASRTVMYPLIVLAAATGCRRGELLALTWPDIDFQSGIVSISKSLEETLNGLRVKSTKSGKPRRFAVPAEALDVLREHRERQEHERVLFGSDWQDNQLVFCGPSGRYYRPDKMSGRVCELATKAGLPGVSLHSLRHSHASELLSKGTPIPTVAKRLGHANANITLSIYSHALEADEVAAAKIWNDAMADVISASRKPRGKRMLADVRAEDAPIPVSDRKKIG